MSPELLNSVGNIIERFGFPVFVALCALALFAFIVRYFVRTIETKDCNFLEYAEKRDVQISTIVENHNQVNLKTVEAVNGLTNSINLRINREIRKEWKDDAADVEKKKEEITAV